MTLAQYLADRRGAATDLAKATGSSVSTITRAANGDISPSLDLMKAIYRATDGAVTPNDFVGIAA